MKLSPFVQDVTERAVKSFSQGILATFIVGDGFNAFHADWGNALGFGLGGAALSVFTSLLSFKLGNSGTASLTTAVEPAGRHAAPVTPSEGA